MGKMRIVYLAICHASPESGIGNKIRDQINYWRNKGHEVELFLITNSQNSVEWETTGFATNTWIDESKFSRPFNRISALRDAQNLNPEIIYVRDAFPFYFFPPRSSRIILEINSVQTNEIKSHSKLKRMIYFIFSKKYYTRWDGLVYVTPEIKEKLESWNPQMRQITNKVISNGVDLNRIPKLKVARGERISFVFLGTPGLIWNGIDSIIDFAEKNLDCDFYVIGESTPRNIPLSSNIKFYGFLNPSEYYEILERSHVALGTMSVNRKEMSQGCSLKTREYLAAGLPTVIRYQDVDFDRGDADFILNIPLGNEPLGFYSTQILNFAKDWQSKRVCRSSLLVVDIATKENARLDFFGSFLDLESDHYHR